jgi:precorrin-6B methylase 2
MSERAPLSETQETVRWVNHALRTWAGKVGMAELEMLLRRLARWRSRALANTYIARQGTRIFSGPFAGMDYLTEAAEGALIPRLLGVYEAELHPYLAAFAASGLDCVIDVGCAEGYYAVGLARLMPGVTIYAHDIEEDAQAACREMARKNGVADRVIVGGEFPPDGFQAFAGRRVLVMVDAEGAEMEILQPEFSPALAGMNIIVETHDVFREHALATMIERFSPTHDIVRLDQTPKVYAMPPWLQELSHLDQLIAAWEWRLRPTPWLVMTPKA